MSLSPFDGRLRNLPFSLAVVDDEGRLVELSEPLAQRAGRPAAELIGALLLGELMDAAPGSDERLRHVLQGPGGEAAFHASFLGDEDKASPSHRVRLRPLREGDRVYAIAFVDDTDGAAVADGAEATGDRIDDVLRRVSVTRHRLNNLLMGLLGQAELLQDSDDLPDAVRDRTKAIMKQVGRLQQAIQEMSDLK